MSRAEQTLGVLTAERPSRGEVLEASGIDFWCAGQRTLAEACEAAGISVQALLAELDAAPEEAPHTALSMTEMADHIESTHHAYLRDELPRLDLLLAHLAPVATTDHAWIPEAQVVFRGLCEEIEAHMWKEEQILFPICRQLDRAAGLIQFHCGSVANPIAVMEHEHDNAAGAVARLRELTGGFAVPDGAPAPLADLLGSLARLEADLHRHIHKENNVLFPRAAAREAELAGATA